MRRRWCPSADQWALCHQGGREPPSPLHRAQARSSPHRPAGPLLPICEKPSPVLEESRRHVYQSIGTNRRDQQQGNKYVASETGSDDSPAMTMRELGLQRSTEISGHRGNQVRYTQSPKSAKNPEHLSVTYVGVHYACLHVWVFFFFFFFFFFF